MREERGQITIEAILIFGMFILILVGISYPLAFRVRADADDISLLSDARFAIEQIGAATDTITTPGSKRTIQVYIPGFKSPGNTSTNVPITHIATRICIDGNNMNSTVLLIRRQSDGTVSRLETHTFTRSLYSSNWGITSSNIASIVEDRGRWHDITLTWQTINSTTGNSISGIDCSTDLTSTPNIYF